MAFQWEGGNTCLEADEGPVSQTKVPCCHTEAGGIYRQRTVEASLLQLVQKKQEKEKPCGTPPESGKGKDGKSKGDWRLPNWKVSTLARIKWRVLLRRLLSGCVRIP